MLNYIGAVKFLAERGFEFSSEDMGKRVATLRLRVYRKTIPHRRRNPWTVVFDRDELDAWLKGEPVPVKTNQKESK